MKLSPLAAGQGVNPPTSNPNAAQTARANAIAKLTGGNPVASQQPRPTNHSINQNNVGLEQLSAISPPTPTLNEEQIDTTVLDEDSEQNQQVEEAAAPVEPAQPSPSAQLSALVRREKALRHKAQQQEQSFKAREAELKAREEALSAKDKTYASGYIPKDQIKQNTLRVLAEAGVSYEELTQQVLNQSQSNPYTDAAIAKLEAKIAELTSKTEESTKQMTGQQQEAKQAALRQISRDVKQLVYSDPSFETIKATNSTKDVVDLIEATFDKEGYVMSVEEAAEEVENYLIDEALKLARLSKVQKRLQPASGTAAGQSKNAQTQQNTQQRQPVKTLTNAIGSTRKMTARERAVAVMEGRLK